MPQKAKLSPEQRYANRRACQEDYRHRVHRFTLQFSLKDTEAFEWFERQSDKGKYLKGLILADKERQTIQYNQTSNLFETNEMEVNDMSIDYNELLCKKMKAEYEDFISDLSTKTPKEIIDHSYEKVFKEEILIICEEKDQTPTEAKALYQQKRPLDYLYQEWLHNEYSYMDMVRDTVDDGAKSAVKEMKERSKGNER